MWHWRWPDRPEDQVPIGAITNGVHTWTWLAPELRDFYAEVLGAGWPDHLDDPAAWAALAGADDARLWAIHRALKTKLVTFARERIQRWRTRTGKPDGNVLNPDALTIGFARRFATYKRATLLFKDVERLKRILHAPGRPVQFLFAGKSHPADQPGKDFIQQVVWASMTPGLAESIIFLEDYDMNIARRLVQGADVWLNTPRRPLEASGTSGMKAALNGLPNLSVLDGWWAEGYNGRNGWAIGDAQTWDNPDAQDMHDALSLYNLLENEVSPRYYHHGEDGIPHDWVATMKAAIMSCGPQFSMRRMLREYVDQLYIPAMRG
jgi:starch phosphorylase